jgi:hypothetical protein
MGAFDFQKATADRIADIFRAATIDENGNEIKHGGQRRVLLADEVGLGKTIVAKEVINRVRKMREAVKDDMFRVVYVCSNMNIVRQNVANLGVHENLDVSESRLSMQHLIIEQKYSRIVAEAKQHEQMPELLIPLTPTTSFSQQGSGTGNMPERALIYAVLLCIDEYVPYKSELMKILRGQYVSSDSASWIYYTNKYNADVAQLGNDYIEKISKYLNAHGSYPALREELLKLLQEPCVWCDRHRDVVNGFRRLFADISLSMLQPDLIVMDEFQRFSSLLDYSDDSEQSAIVRKFFEQNGGQEPLILLLSATPYKPFSTLEELNEYNADTHYEDFNRLMGFMFNNGSEFRTLWSDYSHKLSLLSSEKFDVIIASKRRAEDKMYEAMCRTERLNEGLISTRKVNEVPISNEDILSYCEMQRIVCACKDAASRSTKLRFAWKNIPMEYVKSSPYLLSFMETYELKKQVAAVYSGGFKNLPEPSERVLLQEDDLLNYHKLPMRNARLQYLRDMMLDKSGEAARLLWVPASRPYYTTNAENPFVKYKDFSKVLVFSAWEMVPRMVSTMLTYEAERVAIFSKYKKAGYKSKTCSNRLKKDSQQILTYPSKYLSSLYVPEEWYGKPVNSIKAAIRRQINEKLNGVTKSQRRNYSKILDVLRWLDDQNMNDKPADIPQNTVDILTDMAIASPGVCLYRILGDEESVKAVAQGFVTIFNRRISGYIIDKIQDKYHSDELYLDGVMDYCVLGNLQAVLDEYVYMICPTLDDRAKIIKTMSSAFINDSNLWVDTNNSFGKASGDKFVMHVSYAVPFAKQKKALNEKDEKRSNDIRVAFNSPFYPFVVASTSVGQEGLDFHWYCRKIVHWNLPSNPQDLEQREGRINRFNCLAIRRNLSHLDSGTFGWNELLANARARVENEFADKYTGMVPNWCLPTEWVQRYRDNIEWIERIVPQYPMSSDIERYNRLIDVLSLYRLTMGQPRQEELLDMLKDQNLTKEQISELLFNLSPISRL